MVLKWDLSHSVHILVILKFKEVFKVFAPVMITIKTKKQINLCLLFGKNMLNYANPPTFFFFY